MLELKTPRGLSASVPENDEEDPSPKFHISESEALAKYYQDNGYVVVKGLLTPQICVGMRELWAQEIKGHEGFIYRQGSTRPERNVMNSQGWVMNPILNLQSVDPRRFPRFRKYATEQILASEALSSGFRALLQDDPRVVQSMYFEGNSATPEHQDSFYLDSEEIGTLAAAWIALEDIGATAGRFFVCPKSHKIDYVKHTSANSIVGDYEAYFDSVVAKVKNMHLEIRAPKLNCGDVLFWNSLTIHGSIDSQDATRSRSSITCHAIARSHRFLQLHSRILPMLTDVVGGIEVARPKDLSRVKNRLIFNLETKFPTSFSWVKKQAIKVMLLRR